MNVVEDDGQSNGVAISRPILIGGTNAFCGVRCDNDQSNPIIPWNHYRLPEIVFAGSYTSIISEFNFLLLGLLVVKSFVVLCLLKE